VSLFIATLSYGGAEYAQILNDAKLGILIGSLLSGFLGYTYLLKVLPKK
jgi:NhaA family Na+:H+ antiporter